MFKASAHKLFDDFVFILKSYAIDVKTGLFGEHMDISLELDGPVNIIIDSNKL
jgi:D-tyrosyl-tRNA(Tyr) deacylase